MFIFHDCLRLVSDNARITLLKAPFANVRPLSLKASRERCLHTELVSLLYLKLFLLADLFPLTLKLMKVFQNLNGLFDVSK